MSHTKKRASFLALSFSFSEFVYSVVNSRPSFFEQNSAAMSTNLAPWTSFVKVRIYSPFMVQIALEAVFLVVLGAAFLVGIFGWVISTYSINALECVGQILVKFFGGQFFVSDHHSNIHHIAKFFD